jgi:hypothetical protein
MLAETDKVDALCGLLGEEARVCGTLSEILRAEQAATVGLDPEAILTCLERREVVQDELVRLAAERRSLVRALADERGTRAERVIEVLPFLPPASQDRVRGDLRRLRQALLEARGLGRQQSLVAGASLETVTDLLRALRALVPGARYGNDARIETPSSDGIEQVDRRA